LSNIREDPDVNAHGHPPETLNRPPSRAARSATPFKIISVVAALALVGFIVGVVVTRSKSAGPTFTRTQPHALAAGSRAPSFSLPRLSGGAPVSLATADGQPVVINFFASWCSNCQRELSAVAAAAHVGSGKVAFIGIDTSDTSTTAAMQLLASAGATFPVGIDTRGALATRYGITGLPVTFYVGSDGRIVHVSFGAQSEAELLRWEHRLGASG
jgi:peroxiredoxin